MIHRLSLLFLLIVLPALAADPLEVSSQSIADGHVSRKRAGRLSVVATNTSSDEPLVFVWITVEKKGADGKFQTFRTDILCPCDSKCKREPFRLKKTESASGSWDFLSSDCEPAVSGVYRFAVIARYSAAISGYVYHGVSKEFTITE